DIRAERERARRRGHLVADDARLALLDEVADALIRVAIHDPVAGARQAALALELGRIERDVRQPYFALDEDAAAGDEENLLADEPIQEPHRMPGEVARWLVHLRLVVRDDRPAQFRFDRLHFEPRKGRSVDPDGTAVERARRLDGVEPNDVCRPSVDGVDAV